MKYIVALLLGLFVIAAHAEPTKEVLIFSKDHCPYCEQLKADLDNKLIAAYPNVKFTVLNIKDDENVDRLRKLAKQHKMRNIGLPLMFVGDTYLMGWGNQSEAELDTLLK